MLGAVAAQSGGSIMMIVWIVILFAFMYFFMIRPQQKETKKKNAMMSSLAVGDTVMTTADFTVSSSTLRRIPLSLSSAATETVVSRCRKLRSRR